MPFVPLDSLELATVSRVRSARSTTCSMCNVCISKVLLRPSSLHFRSWTLHFASPELKKAHADRVGRTYTNQADCEYRGGAVSWFQYARGLMLRQGNLLTTRAVPATQTKESSFRPEAAHFAVTVEKPASSRYFTNTLQTIIHRKSLYQSNLPQNKKGYRYPNCSQKEKPATYHRWLSCERE